MNTILLN